MTEYVDKDRYMQMKKYDRKIVRRPQRDDSTDNYDFLRGRHFSSSKRSEKTRRRRSPSPRRRSLSPRRRSPSPRRRSPSPKISYPNESSKVMSNTPAKAPNKPVCQSIPAIENTPSKSFDSFRGLSLHASDDLVNESPTSTEKPKKAAKKPERFSERKSLIGTRKRGDQYGVELDYSKRPSGSKNTAGLREANKRWLLGGQDEFWLEDDTYPEHAKFLLSDCVHTAARVITSQARSLDLKNKSCVEYEQKIKELEQSANFNAKLLTDNQGCICAGIFRHSTAQHIYMCRHIIFKKIHQHSTAHMFFYIDVPAHTSTQNYDFQFVFCIENFAIKFSLSSVRNKLVPPDVY